MHKYVFPAVLLTIFALVLHYFNWTASTIFFSLFCALLGFYFTDNVFLLYTPVVPDLTLFINKFIPPTKSSSSLNKMHNLQNSVDVQLDDGRKKCKICDSFDCLRNISNNSDTKPINFKNFRIPKIVDEALEDFLNVAFQTHVHDWYDAVTDDKCFLIELKCHLRYTVVFLLHRLKCVNLSEFILKKILPPSITMLNSYLTVEEENNNSTTDDNNVNLEQLVLDKIKSNLHCAMYNREAEISYLRSLSEFVLKKSLDPQTSWSSSTLIFLRELLTFGILSPVMDILADPDVINRLLELFFDLDEMETFENVELSEKVIFLDHFAGADRKSNKSGGDSFLQVKLSEILNNQKLFYAFMNYLKLVDGPMNWLQFLLSTRELQDKMNFSKNCDDPNDAYAHLRWEIWELYRNFFHETAADRIDDFSDSLISAELKTAMETSDDMKLLQQILENAYKDIYAKLQTNFVVPFCLSVDFFDYICGDQDSTEFGVEVCADEGEESENLEILDDPDPLASLKRRVSDALTKTVVGEEDTAAEESAENSSSTSELFESETDIIIRENFVADVTERVEDYVDASILSSAKDMTLWTVAMPKVEPRRDPSTGRTMYVYVVVVRRSDASENDLAEREWKLDRRYHEFYVLETKLVEFHGESILGGFPLPPKKTFNTKSRAFVEGMRSMFEQFLKRLLANSHLKNSELLLAFLSCRREFTLSFLSNPLRAVKSIPAKLSFERGQNLMQFLQNFVDSVDVRSTTVGQQQQILQLSTSKSNASLNSLNAAAERNKETAKRKLEKSLFANNFDVVSSSPVFSNYVVDDGRLPVVDGVFDTILFLMRNVFKIPRLVFSFMVGLRVLIKESCDNYVERYLRNKLRLALHERRTTKLIRLLLETLFYDEESVRNENDKTQRRTRAFESINLYFDVEFPAVKKIIGDEQFRNGVRLIFECLQNPRLNKQLSYTLLDCVVRELFPEV